MQILPNMYMVLGHIQDLKLDLLALKFIEKGFGHIWFDKIQIYFFNCRNCQEKCKEFLCQHFLFPLSVNGLLFHYVCKCICAIPFVPASWILRRMFEFYWNEASDSILAHSCPFSLWGFLYFSCLYAIIQFCYYLWLYPCEEFSASLKFICQDFFFSFGLVKKILFKFIKRSHPNIQEVYSRGPKQINTQHPSNHKPKK